MRDYFLKAAEFAREARVWEEAIVGRPNTIAVNSDFSDPFEMIEAFAAAHRKKAQLDAATLERITRRLDELERSADQSSARRTSHPGNDEGSRGYLRCAARDARDWLAWVESFQISKRSAAASFATSSISTQWTSTR